MNNRPCRAFLSAKVIYILVSCYFNWKLLHLRKTEARMNISILNKLSAFFSMQPIQKAWVFGSYSRGDESQGSDIDILVQFQPDANITLFKYAGMVDALQRLLKKKVDLVEEGQLKGFAKDSVNRDKLLIYERKA